MRLGHQVGSRQATIKLTFLCLSCTVPSDYSSTSLNVATSTKFFNISLFFIWTSCPTQTNNRLFEISVFYSWTDTRFFSSEPAAPHKLRGCLLKCEVTLQLSPSWWHLGLPPFGQDLCPRKYLGIFFSQKIQKYCSDFRKITVVWFWHLYQLVLVLWEVRDTLPCVYLQPIENPPISHLVSRQKKIRICLHFRKHVPGHILKVNDLVLRRSLGENKPEFLTCGLIRGNCRTIHPS